MNNDYIITSEELIENYGLDLTEYASDDSYINAIIRKALNMAITRVLFWNDNFEYEDDIELAIDNNKKLIKGFKKLQYQVIYNLIFSGDDNPIDAEVDNIITCDLRWGKINGFQKQIFRK